MSSPHKPVARASRPRVSRASRPRSSQRQASPYWRWRVNCKISTPTALRGESADVAAMFGLTPSHGQTLYDGLELCLSPGEILTVTGPSGAGKSVLLKQAARLFPAAVGLSLDAIARDARPAIEVLGHGPVASRMEALSRCGLADAAAMVTPARRLSGGQQHRLALAAALHRARAARRPTLVIADEFCSTLDTLTARTLCRQVRKLVTRSKRLAMLIATPRADLLEDLRPDVTVVKRLGEEAQKHCEMRIANCELAKNKGARAKPSFGAAVRKRPDVDIVPGTIADYDALGEFHYLAGRPAAHKRVYVARVSPRLLKTLRPAERALVPLRAGVVVVSPPVMNARGRNQALPGRYCGADRSSAIARLNAEMECISRVIVNPAFRGSGLAVALVRHALEHAATPMVEALAAMGAVHPFFELAGMGAFCVADPHAARLISAAQAVGLSRRQVSAAEPVRKLTGSRTPRGRFLRKELNMYMRRAIGNRRMARLKDPLAEACRKASRQYVYYLWGRSDVAKRAT